MKNKLKRELYDVFIESSEFFLKMVLLAISFGIIFGVAIGIFLLGESKSPYFFLLYIPYVYLIIFVATLISNRSIIGGQI